MAQGNYIFSVKKLPEDLKSFFHKMFTHFVITREKEMHNKEFSVQFTETSGGLTLKG